MQKQFEDLAIFPGSELQLIGDFLAQEGIKDSQWLLGTGLTRETIKSPGNAISLRQFDIIYRNAYRLAQRPGLGIDLGLSLNLSRWGVLSSALLCANTLGHALSIAHEFRDILRSRFSMNNEVRDGYLIVTLVHKPEMAFPVNEIFAHEVFLGTMRTQISQLISRPFRFNNLRLPYPKPTKDKHYHKIAENVLFNAADAQFSIPLKLLQQTLPLKNRVTREAAQLLCQDELERVRNARTGDIVYTVSGILAQYGSELPDLNTIASKLSISPRTLRRKLQQANTQYRTLCEYQRQQLALSLMTSADHSLSVIAQRCGYKDAASFHKAFKRWTGESPGQYRTQLQGMDES